MRVTLREQLFDPWQELSLYQQMALGREAKHGAVAAFVGTVRDFNEDSTVQSMRLDYYPGMTERYLERIAAEAMRRWDILDALIVHRYGQLQPGDPIVLLAVWSAHRAAAFDACRYLIEELKSRAPFWKKETLPDGARWVSRNTSG
jgi:molybdopterin synthase catalytic subunit